MKVAKDKSGFLAGSSLPPKQIPKDQENQVTSDVSTEQKVKEQGHQVSSDFSPVEKSDAVFEAVDDTEYGQSQGFEGRGFINKLFLKFVKNNGIWLVRFLLIHSRHVVTNLLFCFY